MPLRGSGRILAIGASITVVATWLLVSFSRDTTAYPSQPPSPRDKVPRPTSESREAPIRLRAILEGSAPLPLKFATLEELLASLDDRELEELLASIKPDADNESPATWLFCALWSEKGRRANSITECPSLPDPVKLSELAKAKDPFLETYRINAEDDPYHAQLEDDLRQQGLAWACFLRGHAKRDPDAAWEHSFAGRGGTGLEHEIHFWLTGAIFQSWARVDPVEAYEKVMAVDYNDIEGRFSTGGFYRGVDPILIPRFVDRINHAGYESQSEEIHGTVAGYWAASAPDEAWSWLQKQWPQDRIKPREAAIGCFLNAWEESDPEGMARWCLGSGRDAKELLGNGPFFRLLGRAPLLAATLTEGAWPAGSPEEISQTIDGLRPWREDMKNPAIKRVPWNDDAPVIKKWTREFEQAAPRLSIPEQEVKVILEWLEKPK